MALQDQDEDYWRSRWIKINEEYNKLRELKHEKQKRLEEQKKILEEGNKKIEDLKSQIKLFLDYPQKSQETDSISKSSNDESTQIDSKDENLYEFFFILGQNRVMDEPGTIFSYPENNEFSEGPQSRVLANFAFPTELKTKQYKLNKLKRKFEKLAKKPLKRDGSHFVFSVKSNNENQPSSSRERANFKKDLVYCCCVFRKQVMDSVDGLYVVRPVCYCLATYFPCFEFLFDLLFYSVKQIQIEEFELIQNCSDDEYSLQNAIQRIIMKDPDILDPVKFYEGREIQHNPIIYNDFSKRIGNFEYLDTLWFCSNIFSLLKFDDFWYILCAILQESSILFMGNNLDVLSSCVLGFHGLIRPLYWSHVLTPILPASLFELIESPFPLLAGIPLQKGFEFKSKHSHLIIVELGRVPSIRKPKKNVENNVSIAKYDRALKMKYEYHKFMSERSPGSGKANDDIIVIVKKVKKFIEDQFLGINREESVYETIENLKKKTFSVDEFRYKFFSTQMSITYIEEYYQINGIK